MAAASALTSTPAPLGSAMTRMDSRFIWAVDQRSRQELFGSSQPVAATSII
jgi:hypothetical protein